MISNWKIGEMVTMHKKHPCGSYHWEIYRLGADVGIRCFKCKHYLTMERRELQKNTRNKTPHPGQIKN